MERRYYAVMIKIYFYVHSFYKMFQRPLRLVPEFRIYYFNISKNSIILLILLNIAVLTMMAMPLTLEHAKFVYLVTTDQDTR